MFCEYVQAASVAEGREPGSALRVAIRFFDLPWGILPYLPREKSWVLTAMLYIGVLCGHKLLDSQKEGFVKTVKKVFAHGEICRSFLLWLYEWSLAVSPRG